MDIITSCSDMRDYSSAVRKSGAAVGLVPTMGALHDGHLSLLKIARQHCNRAVMSVFVNPAQFGPAEDFGKYPRQFEKDRELAESAGCDCLFIPAVQEMYPENYNTYIIVENVTTSLCGASRPTHFRGVATVVLKLFNIVSPDIAVFGAKDAQQVIVIKRMALDLNLSVKIIAAPIIREADGLAMSSRNAYLSKNERDQAALIYKGLTEAKKLYDSGEMDSQVIKECVISILDEGRLIKPEYIEIVDTVLIRSLDKIDRAALIAVACRMIESGTRLIDNIALGGEL
jgi:pantoate--beta-alanine ligase